MRRGETREAVEAARKLSGLLHDGAVSRTGLETLREAFLKLLDLRGYFTASTRDVARSVSEIRDVGEGFDLYDLSAALAACDVAATEGRRLPARRFLPELSAFSVPGRFDKETSHGA